MTRWNVLRRWNGLGRNMKMKRMIAVLLCLAVVFAHFPICTAVPKTYTNGDFQYFLADDGTAVISGYTGKYSLFKHSPYMLDIPATLDGHAVAGIDEYAFYDKAKPTSITIPDSVTSIGVSAFYACYRLAYIDVAEKNPAYSQVDGVLFDKSKKMLYTYPGGKSNTAYVIPEGTLAVGPCAFSWSSYLTSVTIPSSLTSIGKLAFVGCMSLTSVIIPDNVTSIGVEAYNACYNLTNIQVTENNPVFTHINGVLFDKTQKLLHTYPSGKSDTVYAIPEGTLSIGIYAFANCNNLAGVTIPDSVTSIGNGAFNTCKGLKSVTLPASVTRIDESAFDRDTDGFTLTVERGSYGEQFAIEKKIPYIYPIN